MIDTGDAARKLIAGFKKNQFAVVELRESGFNISVSMETIGRSVDVPCFRINWPGCGDKTPQQSRVFGRALREAEDIADKAEVLWSLFSNEKAF